MKNIIKKISAFLKTVFGYGIMICLFLGGFTFFGYIAALIIGGSGAAAICSFIYGKLFPAIVYTASVLVLLGLFIMYLNGEKSLVPKSPKK